MRGYWSNKIAVTWDEGDIISVAISRGAYLTPEERREILDEMLRNHDASFGINWDTLDRAIEGKGRPMTSAEVAEVANDTTYPREFGAVPEEPAKLPPKASLDVDAAIDRLGPQQLREFTRKIARLIYLDPDGRVDLESPVSGADLVDVVLEGFCDLEIPQTLEDRE